MNFYELGENMKNATSKDIYFSQFSEKKNQQNSRDNKRFFRKIYASVLLTNLFYKIEGIMSPKKCGIS